MNKLKAKDLGCFRQVAKVIGKKSAEVELQRVLDYVGSYLRDISSPKLHYSFCWANNPQCMEDESYKFWRDIHYGKIPAGYKAHYKYDNKKKKPVIVEIIKRS